MSQPLCDINKDCQQQIEQCVDDHHLQKLQGHDFQPSPVPLPGGDAARGMAKPAIGEPF